MKLTTKHTLGLLWLAASIALPRAALAKSWCAYPIWVHEWGVHVFTTAGLPAAPAPLPSFFLTPLTTAHLARKPTPARDLPVDGGEREIPILQFYAPGDRRDAPIPVGLEVGFTGGPATSWYPDVDLLRLAADANSPEAKAARAGLLVQRAARSAFAPNPPTPADPTRQLVWDRLELSATPAHPPAPSSEPWVVAARRADALWVGGESAAERFVYYEAHSDERLPLRLTRGATWAAGHRHYVLANTGLRPIQDVFIVQRDGGHTFVFYAPSIPAGASAGFLLEEHQVDGRERAETYDHLRALLVDPATPAPPKEYRWDRGECVMQRDPAIPVEAAKGHRLYAQEVDALLALWGPRFFERPGTTILYREDTATLDEAMPLSIYTDMFHFVELQRAGLALWEAPALP